MQIFNRNGREPIECQKSLSLMGIIAAVTLGLAGCTKYEISDHSYQFNEAIGSLGNRLLLLNAARAAKNYPMQFSKIASYTGGGRVSGSISTKFPYPYRTIGNPSSVINATLDPSLDFGSGVSQLQIADLDTAEAQRHLKNPIEDNDISYYVAQGWTPRVVFTTLIESIAVKEEVFNTLHANYSRLCQQSPKDKICWIEQTKASGCINSFMDNKNAVSYGVLYEFKNNPRTTCEYYRFQWVLEAFNASGIIIDTQPPEKLSSATSGGGTKTVAKTEKFSVDINLNVDDGKTSKGRAERPSLIEYSSQGFRDFIFSQTKIYSDNRRGSDGRVSRERFLVRPIKFQARSPERMVRFMGDIIAAQSLQSPSYIPTVRVGEFRDVELFSVRRSNSGKSHSAVSILDPEGQRISIPIPDYGSGDRHRSMEVMSLVTDVLNTAVSGKDLPRANTVLLAGN